MVQAHEMHARAPASTMRLRKAKQQHRQQQQLGFPTWPKFTDGNIESCRPYGATIFGELTSYHLLSEVKICGEKGIGDVRFIIFNSEITVINNYSMCCLQI
jgi:hypothetical protein